MPFTHIERKGVFGFVHADRMDWLILLMGLNLPMEISLKSGELCPEVSRGGTNQKNLGRRVGPELGIQCLSLETSCSGLCLFYFFIALVMSTRPTGNACSTVSAQ